MKVEDKNQKTLYIDIPKPIDRSVIEEVMEAINQIALLYDDGYRIVEPAKKASYAISVVMTKDNNKEE